MRRTILRHLFGYSDSWFEIGVLPVSLLRTQLRNYRAEEDHHPEHYRYQAFSAYAQSVNASVPTLLNLVKSEPDPTLKESMVILMLRSKDQAKEAIGSLTEIIVQDNMWSAKQALLDYIIMSDIGGVSLRKSRWPALLKLSDHALSEWISSASCSLELLAYLAANSSTKRLRNQAQQQIHIRDGDRKPISVDQARQAERG